MMFLYPVQLGTSGLSRFQLLWSPNTFCAQARYLVMVLPILLQFLQLFATHMSKNNVIYIVVANAAYCSQMLHLFCIRQRDLVMQGYHGNFSRKPFNLVHAQDYA